MATYAIGDVQGCSRELQALLTHIQFQPHQDQLWLAGDVVNRGPDSLGVLRFLVNLPIPPVVVLGNHDLHLLTLALTNLESRPHDTFHDVLDAPDGAELISWLQHRPFLHHDPIFACTLIHAGLMADWSVAQASTYAREIEAYLQGPNAAQFLKDLQGDIPISWKTAQKNEMLRYRFLVNVFTRLRFCTADGIIDWHLKGAMGSQPEPYLPWFNVPNRVTAEEDILFGHWAALHGVTHNPHAHALDTGCAWGETLTAMRLEDGKRFSVPFMTTP